MRRPRDRRHSKAGVTLVEVMLAGALTVIAALATLEGFIVAAKVAHENAEELHADGVAFDRLWNEFNHDFDALKQIDNSDTNSSVRVCLTNNSTAILVTYDYVVNGRNCSLSVLRSNIPRFPKSNAY